jgi:hypothetical protein
MSANTNTKRVINQKSSKTRIPVCAYCKNINQPGIPTDHWLRESPDPKSPITCPILRWEECSWCGIDGHTKKYCADFICFLESKKNQEKESAVFIQQTRKALEEKRRAQSDAKLEKEDETPADEDISKEETPKEDPGIITETEFPVLSGKPVSSSKTTSQSASVWGTFTNK